ncbi:MAG: DUF4149 domain-containing protein [Gammaproteobacteria bacterium]|nr:DUF4149 domain-containing protein [Gammaproteobacteria bacterium]
MVQTGGEKILLTLWIGALWTIGFIAVPILFASIEDKQIAGLLAGKMFTVVSYIGLFCGLVLLISELRHSESLLFNKKKNKRFWLLIVMLVLVIIGEFLIQPQMAALKQSGLSVSPEFDQLHGIATTLYMLNCLLGLILVIFKPE